MKHILFLCAFLFVANVASATNYNVISQADWNAIPNSLPSGDTIFINGSATIVTSVALTIEGVLINYGDFTIGSNFNVSGYFINAGEAWLRSTLIVGGNGTFFNTGNFHQFGDIISDGEFISCNLFEFSSASITGTSIISFDGTNLPLGTPCNDGDDETINDIIINEGCNCAGGLPPPTPIPAMGEWGLGILSLFLIIFGIVIVRQRTSSVVI